MDAEEAKDEDEGGKEEHTEGDEIVTPSSESSGRGRGRGRGRGIL